MGRTADACSCSMHPAAAAVLLAEVFAPSGAVPGRPLSLSSLLGIAYATTQARLVPFQAKARSRPLRGAVTCSRVPSPSKTSEASHPATALHHCKGSKANAAISDTSACRVSRPATRVCCTAAKHQTAHCTKLACHACMHAPASGNSTCSMQMRLLSSCTLCCQQ
jgi:hypothetical protein